MSHRPAFCCFPTFAALSVSILLGCCCATIVSAQSDADRALTTQSQLTPPIGAPTGIEGGRAASSPNDADLGEQEILKRAETYQPFTAAIGGPIYWTSNVALSRHGEKSDVIEAPVAAIYYEPRISQTLYGLVDVREQLFYYDRFDGFDFGSFDVDVGLTYMMPQVDNLILRLNYNYNRLTKKDSFDDFFSNHSVILNGETESLREKMTKAERY